ncbi:hypothetical protein PLESTM_000283900 [Pleodorina starrii]|nr:hypothetical protein PLESTM_000283900 [Pleodorina starrii]
MVLICALIARPALVHSLSGVAKSASVGLWALHHGDRGGALENAAIDETSTVAIVNKLAADSRRSARAESSTASRRERMWPTAAGLSTRQQQQQQGAAASQRGQGSASSSHPVYLVAAAANTTQIRKADSVAAADAEAKGMTVADAAVITKNATAAALGTGTKAAVSDAKSTSSAAAGGTAKAVATTVPKSASFPPFKEPVVPFPGRAANAPPIVGVVFYGRRDRVRILDCYLQRNMIRNGGLLAYVVFVTATWQPQDVEFLDRLVAARGGDYRKLYPQRLDKGYTGHYAWMDPATLYVKVDDDVVYIADHAIDHMLIAHNLHRYHLISANVINHQPLELPHSQAGAHFTFEQTRPGDKASWQPAMRPATAAAKAAGAAAGGAAGATAVAPALERVPFMDNGWDVWGDWRRAANVHYSFLANHAAGRLGVYDFPPAEQLWDFNRHFGYTRWRINMIMFKGTGAVGATGCVRAWVGAAHAMLRRLGVSRGVGGTVRPHVGRVVSDPTR